VKKGGCHREDSKLVVMGSLPRVEIDPAIHSAFTHSDMTTSTTWVTPYGNVQNTQGLYSFIIRTRDGKEVIGHLRAVENLAEGMTWSNVFAGSRIPTAVLLAKPITALVETLRTVDPPVYYIDSTPAWAAQQGISSRLWVDEWKCGMKILYAEKREGGKRFLSHMPVFEKIPKGWMRDPDTGILAEED
jgi:hypothetical protein